MSFGLTVHLGAKRLDLVVHLGDEIAQPTDEARRLDGARGRPNDPPLDQIDHGGVISAQTAQKPKLYDTDAANANARLSTQLPYIMAMSRFAHYLKAMMRDKIGSFMSCTDCERWLNQWITNYVTPDDTASRPDAQAAPA